MSIIEGREEQPHWVVRREEVELTEEVLGTAGGWGVVKVAKFRNMAQNISNQHLFTREMEIACHEYIHASIAQDVAQCALRTSGGPTRSSIVTSAVPMCYSSPSLMAAWRGKGF